MAMLDFPKLDAPFKKMISPRGGLEGFSRLVFSPDCAFAGAVTMPTSRPCAESSDHDARADARCHGGFPLNHAIAVPCSPAPHQQDRDPAEALSS